MTTSSAGFTAEYYNNPDFTDLKFTQTDTTIDFDWKDGSPNAAIDPESFSVRWTGQIKPQFSETYTFTSRSDDGVKLWVNDELLIDKLVGQGVTDHQGTITLEAGKIYDIRLDYFENVGFASVQLYWQSASQAFEIVPAAPSDTIAPDIVSIQRQTPAAATTNADTLIFKATFSEDVQGVEKGDFVVTGNSQAAVQAFTQLDASTYEITVAGGNLDDFNGVVGLSLIDGGIDITDQAGNKLSSTAPTLETYTLRNTTEENNANTRNNNSSNNNSSNNSNENNTSQLTLLNGGKILEITQFGAAEALQITTEISKVFTVGTLRIFSTEDGSGSNSQLIGEVSIAENQNNILPRFTPTTTLLKTTLANANYLQFELEEKGVKRLGSLTDTGNGKISVSFDDGTQLGLTLETTSPVPNLLRNDASLVDLTNNTGALTISGSIHREAAMDNVVDLYVTDAEGAVFDTMGNKLMPGDIGYKDAAIAKRLNLNLTGTNGQVKAFNANLTGGMYLGIFVAIDGVDPLVAKDNQILFGHSSANQNRDHIKSLGDNVFGIEDQPGLGDSDFNDVIISFKIQQAIV